MAKYFELFLHNDLYVVLCSLKIRQSDTKYQSLSHERLGCQTYARDHRKLSKLACRKLRHGNKKANKKYANLTQVTKS